MIGTIIVILCVIISCAFLFGYVIEPAGNIKVTFKDDIRPLFTDRDIKAMMFAFDLSEYEDVKKHSRDIYDYVSKKQMPCYGPWSDDKIRLFKSWMDQGMQE